MSAIIQPYKSKFVIFGSGYDDTRNDSGDGELPRGVWYDALGNQYQLMTTPATIPMEAGQNWYTGEALTRPNASIIANNDGYSATNGINVYNNEFGASYYNLLKSMDYLLFDTAENSNIFTPYNLQGFSVKNLMDLGLLNPSTASSVILYKGAPLSDTYVIVNVASINPDYVSPANPPYDQTIVNTFGVSFTMYKNGLYLYTYTANIQDLDVGFCELTKFDGTKGLGFAIKNINRMPYNGTANYVIGYLKTASDNAIFGEYDTYFGVG